MPKFFLGGVYIYIINDFKCMGINEIFINKRKINKKERVYQVHISAANLLRALKMVQIESKDNALLPLSLIA